jgi:predicted TIM-barrel fold metal-dependent hydrolase
MANDKIFTKSRGWVARMASRDDWLAQVRETILDPDREIVDPHHHLWDRGGSQYLLEHLWSDTESGHKVSETMFVECRAGYLDDGPEHLRPIGETRFVTEIAEASAETPDRATIAGIVAHADLAHPALDETLNAHEDASHGLFRGIRHAGAHEPHADALRIPGRAPKGLYFDEAYRAGVARLGERGLTFDTWHYHHQNQDFVQLAKSVPGTTMVLDHFGTPLGVGPYSGRRTEIFAAWKDDIAAIAECPNVVAKVGGLAMPDNGFGWEARDTPATSDEFVAAQAPYYHHALACFGPERCMFESNFPVDRTSISYPVLWNGLKKIAANYDDAAQDQLFSGTARRTYRL